MSPCHFRTSGWDTTSDRRLPLRASDLALRSFAIGAHTLRVAQYFKRANYLLTAIEKTGFEDAQSFHFLILSVRSSSPPSFQSCHLPLKQMR